MNGAIHLKGNKGGTEERFEEEDFGAAGGIKVKGH